MKSDGNHWIEITADARTRNTHDSIVCKTPITDSFLYHDDAIRINQSTDLNALFRAAKFQAPAEFDETNRIPFTAPQLFAEEEEKRSRE